MNSFLPLLISVAMMIAVKIFCKYTKFDFGISFFAIWLLGTSAYYLIEISTDFDNPMLRFWICQYGAALTFALLVAPCAKSSKEEEGKMAINIFARILTVGFFVLVTVMFGMLAFVAFEVGQVFGIGHFTFLGWNLDIPYSFIFSGIVTTCLLVWAIYAGCKASQDAKKAE